MSTAATESGVDAVAFRPSADRFGATLHTVLRCSRCGHGFLAAEADPDRVAEAYEAAEDPVSIREEAGQVETARRALAGIERYASPGRLLDVGCWTGSFVAAAASRGWAAHGIEPSTWAVDRARQRGLEVEQATLETMDAAAAYRCVVACDVLEHLDDPADALCRMRALLDEGGVAYLTLPDAGSMLARVMGRRWWSVLPMHVQYFTRESITRLLGRVGLDVVEITTHPKMFSGRYYGERIAAFVPVGASVVERVAARALGGERLIGPDFRDRMAVISRVSASGSST